MEILTDVFWRLLKKRFGHLSNIVKGNVKRFLTQITNTHLYNKSALYSHAQQYNLD